jgi:hypothetical protein
MVEDGPSAVVRTAAHAVAGAAEADTAAEAAAAVTAATAADAVATEPIGVETEIEAGRTSTV